MKIIQLTIENVKRIKAVNITANGDSVILSGKNDQSKSSVLDSIWYAMGGKDSCPSDPIRHGEDTAKIVVDLGDLIVTRRWTQSNTYLQVTNAEGAIYKSPQAMLDALVGRLSFDPLAFGRMGGKERRQTLLEIVDVGIDLDQHDAKTRAAYDHRRDVGRELKRLEAEAKGMTSPAVGCPTDELSVSAAAGDLDKANAARRQIEDAQRRLRGHDEAADARVNEINDLREKLAAAVEKQTASGIVRGSMVAEIGDYIDNAPDVDAARHTLDTVDGHNQQVRMARAYRGKAAELEEQRQVHRAAEASLESLNDAKRDALAAADLPVAGLGLTDDEVTFEDVPWEQLSSSKSLRVSLAIAMRLNPKLKVIRIQNGNDLDSDGMRLIQDMAAAEDYQLWIERVDESGKVGVVIEDGEVAQ